MILEKGKLIEISIVLANLSAGGAERVLSFIAQELDKSKFKCTLVIIGHEKDTAYDIKGINVVYFEKHRVLKGIVPLFKYISKNRPDIVVSAVAHLNTITAYMSILFPRVKFIAREVSISSVADSINKRQIALIEFLVKRRFNYFDKIICQSQAMCEDLIDQYPINEEKLVLINNPISDGFIKKTKNLNSSPLKLITVGSFKKIKGHERIIRTLGTLDFPFHYTMIGDGSEKTNIFDLITEFGLEDQVTHIPFTKDVASYLSESDVFLQGSFSEGFPNALIESCAVGVPVLVLKAPGGHNEIIIDGVNGHIIENESLLAKKLKELDESFYFDTNIVADSVESRYGKDIILAKYEALFENVLV